MKRTSVFVIGIVLIMALLLPFAVASANVPLQSAPVAQMPEPAGEWDQEALAMLTGTVISLVFGYLPGASDWFEKMPSKYKPLFMLGLLLLVSAGHLAVTCRFAWACIQINAERYFWIWVSAVVANQVTFLVGVKQFKKPVPVEQPARIWPTERYRG